MAKLYFTTDHEWIAVEGSTGTVGITDHAQMQLGDVVYAEVPAVGRVVKKGEAVATVESVKAASEIYSPVSGTVIAGNAALGDEPALVNQAAEGDGWFFRVGLSDLGELDALMDRAAYDQFVKDN